MGKWRGDGKVCRKREWYEQWRGTQDMCQRQEELKIKKWAMLWKISSAGWWGCPINLKITGAGMPFCWPLFIELYYWQCWRRS